MVPLSFPPLVWRSKTVVDRSSMSKPNSVQTHFSCPGSLQTTFPWSSPIQRWFTMLYPSAPLPLRETSNLEGTANIGEEKRRIAAVVIKKIDLIFIEFVYIQLFHRHLQGFQLLHIRRCVLPKQMILLHQQQLFQVCF